jgi:Holliday junction resolvasome RuvABC endonuclease subunit
MRIIAFDLGQNMAAAWLDECGQICVTSKWFEGTRVERAGPTAVWLQELVFEKGFTTVIYERPFARGFHATRCLWGLAGLVEACASASLVACLDVTPSTIKEWATGKGTADKSAMIARARELGYNGTNEHEADAYLLCRYGLANIRINPPKKKRVRKNDA